MVLRTWSAEATSAIDGPWLKPKAPHSVSPDPVATHDLHAEETLCWTGWTSGCFFNQWSGWRDIEGFRIDSYILPWNLTWNLKMEVWKMIFLFSWVLFRLHVKFQGCIDLAKQLPGSTVWHAFFRRPRRSSIKEAASCHWNCLEHADITLLTRCECWSISSFRGQITHWQNWIPPMTAMCISHSCWCLVRWNVKKVKCALKQKYWRMMGWLLCRVQGENSSLSIGRLKSSTSSLSLSFFAKRESHYYFIFLGNRCYEHQSPSSSCCAKTVNIIIQ